MTNDTHTMHAQMRAQNHIHAAMWTVESAMDGLRQIDALLDVDGFRASDAEVVIAQCGLAASQVRDAIVVTRLTTLVVDE